MICFWLEDEFKWKLSLLVRYARQGFLSLIS